MSLIKITQNKTKDENQRNVIFPLDNRHFITDLTGKFVVTGLFTLMRRSDVVHYIYSHGGTVLSAPTRATDYLIVGGEKSKTWKYGQYGTKIRKGLDLREKDEKILIISEEDFMRCIGG